MKRPGKILCVSTTGMGNAILYIPVIKTLHRFYPEAAIDVMVSNQAAAGILEGIPGLAHVLHYRKQKSSLLRHARTVIELRRAGYDLFVASFLDKSAKVALLGCAAGIPERIGYNNGWWKRLYTRTAGIDGQKHEVEYNLDLVRGLGDGDCDGSITVSCHLPYEQRAAELLSRSGVGPKDTLIGIHPGSGVDLGRNIKRWPVENYARLADELAKKYGAKVAVFGGPSETALAERLAALAGAKPVLFAGELSIAETAAVIAKCMLFISNDSGLMHVAASVGVPVTAVFGPTLHWKNHPWGVPYRIVRRELPCSPCYRLKGIQCDEPRCLTSVSVDEVFAAAQELLKADRT